MTKISYTSESSHSKTSFKLPSTDFVVAENTESWFMSDHHKVLIEKIKEYTHEYIYPAAETIRQTQKIPDEVIECLKENRLMGLIIPREYGGGSGDCISRLLSVQHVSSISPDVGALLQIAQLGTGGIIDFGSPAQKMKWLPALARGQKICSVAITEELSGSNIMEIATTYRKVDNGFLLNGEKWFIGNSPIANIHIVCARNKINPEEFSTFIVEGECEGVDNTHRHVTLGLRAFPFGVVKFENVIIPEKNLLGKIGQGKDVAYQIISRHGVPSLMALALGIHERIMNITVNFCQARRLYDRPISKIRDVRNKIFEIYSNYEVSRQVSYQAAYLESNGQRSFRALALAKQIASENCCRSALIASEIFGARAGLPEFEISQLLLDALMTRPPSGTGDVQRKRVLENLLEGRAPHWEEYQISNLRT